jgi:hypothetical protein
MAVANSSNISTIQILRSYANSAPSTLVDGQLAFSFVSNTLYIGSNTGGVIAISDQATANLARQLANTIIGMQGVDVAQNTSINVATVLANAAYAQANVTIGVDVTQNTRLTVIEATDVSQNARMTIIEATDVSQNNRLTIIENTNLTQNTNIAATDGKMSSAYNQANTGTVLAQAAFDNSNTKFASAGGTISGNVIISKDLTVTGNLSVLGNTTTISTSTLDIGDSLIYLANNNYFSDVVDIGIIGHYNPGSSNAHTGIFRDPVRKEWIFFQGYQPEVQSNNIINIADPTFAYANVWANTFKGNLIGTTVSVSGSYIFPDGSVQTTAASANLSAGAYNQANTATVLAQASFNTANNAVANIGPVITTNTTAQVIIANTAASTSNTTGALVVKGGLGVTGNLNAGLITSNGNIGITAQSVGAGGFIGSGVGFDQVTTAASAFGRIQLYSLSDGLMYLDSGYSNGGFTFRTSNPLYTQFKITNTTSAVNYLQVSGNTTGSGPSISVSGSDTNADMYLFAKGTGRINVASKMVIGSVNFSNSLTDGLLVANTITGGAIGFGGTNGRTLSSYQNGVQSNFDFSAAQVYYSGDLLVGGKISSPNSTTANLWLTTTASNSTVFIDRTVYIANANNSVSNTTGALIVAGGVGVTGNTYLSGNVVVSNTSTNLNTLQYSQGSYSTESYFGITNSSTFAALRFNITPSTGGTGYYFNTYGSPAAAGWPQFLIGHTSSSVNYLQVSGNTTGNGPVISAQGSDANTDINLVTKGTGSVRFNINTGSLTTSYDPAGNQTSVVGTGNMNWAASAGGAHRFFTRGLSAQQFQITDTASTVNYVNITGNTTNNPVVISAQGSDANIGINLTPKGSGSVNITSTLASTSNTTGALVVSGGVGILGDLYANTINVPTDINSVNGTPIATFGGPSLTDRFIRIRNNTTAAFEIGQRNAFTTTGGQLLVGGTALLKTGLNKAFAISVNDATNFEGILNTAFWIDNNGNTRITSTQASTSTNTGSLSVSGGLGVAGATYTGSIVTGAGTVSLPSIAIGATNRGFYNPTAGDVGFVSGGWEQVRYIYTGPTVNYLTFTGSGTGNSAIIGTAGTDNNISLLMQPKGTGAFNISTANGVNLSSGNTTVTALTIIGNGTNYTSAPSVVITAPTIAGGVQATASVATYNNSGISAVNFGGTGYTVGDTLSIVGGTPVGGAATLTVGSVSGGVITSVTYGNFASYSALPTNPVSVTGGTGSGATFNIAWKVLSFSITNAGSGYVEQPTVTISGGGGSGATAYATVGGSTIIKSLGSPVLFQTAGGTQLGLYDTTSTVYPYISGGTSSASIGVVGTPSANFFISARGTGSVFFQTNNFGQTQLNISHTASAVNYVNITGNTTNNPPVISAQGSDSVIDLWLQAKGTGQVKAVNPTNMIMSSVGQNGFGSFLAQSSTGSSYYFGYTAGFETGRIAFNAGNTISFLTGSNPSSSEQLRIFNSSNAVNYIQVTGGAAGSAVQYQATGTDPNVYSQYRTKGTGAHDFYTNNNLQLRVSDTANAVNRVELTGAATGSGPTISVQGSDPNVALNFSSKAAQNINFRTGASSLAQFVVVHNGATIVNQATATGSATGVAPSFGVQGTDTNIDLTVSTKGTGSIYFNSQGSTVPGSNTNLMIGGTVANTVNYLNILGNSTGAAPSISMTGSDPSINFQLTTKGNGGHYIQTNSFNQTQLLVSHTASAVNYLQVTGAVTGGSPSITAAGSDAAVNMVLSSKSSGSIFNYTNNGSQLQFAVAHTASAVNYIQVTGAATNFIPAISAQGSDPTIGMGYYAKGGSSHYFSGSSIFAPQFKVGYSSASAVNYLQAIGSVASSAPVLSAQGSDTDVGINLTAKGNGSVNITSTLASTSNTTGSLVVSGGLGVGGNVSMNLASAGAGVNRLTLSQLNSIYSGDTAGNIILGGSGYYYFATSSGVYVQNSFILRGPITNDQGNNTVVFGASSPVKILNATASTNTTTGALIVQGGVGISGALNATTKSFNIPHPTKAGKSLRYGSLEGPEFGVYVRGTLKGSNTIQLPDYWIVLADPDSITVQLTAIGKTQNLFVKEIRNNKVIVGVDGLSATDINCYYTVFGERADVAKLEVEG